MKRAIFLDRDGVICQNREDYVKEWSEFRFLPRVAEALRRLQEEGFLLVVVTNQSAINRGLVSAESVDQINARMSQELQREGVHLDAIYYCPHRPDEDCNCRKPKPGLLVEAVSELGIAPQRSYLIGDALSDIEAGQTVGLVTVLVLSGKGRETLGRLSHGDLNPAHVSPDLRSAVDWILDDGAFPVAKGR